jgi:ribosome-binding factor A
VTTLKDPRIGFVTITDVRTTPDFSKATVFYTVLPARSDASAPDRAPTHPPGSSAEASDRSAVLGDEDADTLAEQRTAEGLASATPLLRRELGARMRLRHVPALEFVLDPVPAQGRRIEDLLDEVRTQR